MNRIFLKNHKLNEKKNLHVTVIITFYVANIFIRFVFLSKVINIHNLFELLVTCKMLTKAIK